MQARRDFLRQVVPAGAAGLVGLKTNWLARVVSAVDPTLERTVQSARNAALAGTQEIEKKLIASLKRESETLLRQISRARDAVYPRGEPQERVLTLASFLIRYGPGLLDALGDEVARWADAP